MAYTQNGLVLCKLSTSHKERSANIFRKLKRLFEMMLNTTLVCTKLVCHFAKFMTSSKKQCTYKIRSSFEAFLGYCQIAMSFGLLMHKIFVVLFLQVDYEAQNTKFFSDEVCFWHFGEHEAKIFVLAINAVQCHVNYLHGSHKSMYPITN